jgi:hypothetical protein
MTHNRLHASRCRDPIARRELGELGELGLATIQLERFASFVSHACDCRSAGKARPCSRLAQQSSGGPIFCSKSIIKARRVRLAQLG